jgi:hypothetical protein
VVEASKQQSDDKEKTKCLAAYRFGAYKLPHTHTHTHTQA